MAKTQAKMVLCGRAEHYLVLRKQIKTKTLLSGKTVEDSPSAWAVVARCEMGWAVAPGFALAHAN